MKLPSQVMVEVEPLSDVRWSRIERELFAKLDERPLPGSASLREAPAGRRVLAWAATFAVAAGALIAIFYAARPSLAPDRVVLATTESWSRATVGESSLRLAPHSLVMVGGDDEHGIDVVL
ncbi:MAG: hypothetical protein JOZ69_11440, partial [Myxococcales bacterium]|nr:hypothetical protein [Myxococcales bacterium]